MPSTQITSYGANKNYATLLLFFCATLSIVSFLTSDPLPVNKVYGLLGFWIISFTIFIFPWFFRIEISDSSVSSYFAYWKTLEIRPHDVVNINYANLYAGGLGFGKALFIDAVQNGRTKRFKMGEYVYGKKAVDHARRVLMLKQ